MYRVLLVLPDGGTRISQAAEADWISRTFQTEILEGTRATTDGLYDFVAGRKFDIVHFAAHGDADGLLMSGGTRLTMYDVERVARTVGAKLVYLNSCASARLAQFAVDHGIPAVIATNADIDDTQAWSTAISFYQELLVTGDFYGAYEAAKPMDGSLSFYSDGHLVSRQIRPLLDEMALMRRHLKRLYYVLGVTWVAMLVEFAVLWWRSGG